MAARRFSFLVRVLSTPARVSVLLFASLVALGTLLLALPQAGRSQPLSLVDALFTSTSATCVTGLVVVDTGTALSRFGQLVVLGLIQVGGLGIMTVSTAFLLAAGHRPGLAGRQLIRDTYTASGVKDTVSLILEVIRFTFCLEGIGAALLYMRFLFDHDPAEAAYLAIFHAVSAFCNAGFALFPDSLARFHGDWLVNLVVSALIVCGGIGFIVLAELRHRFPWGRAGWRRLSLHARLVLTTTAALLAAGTVLILVMERHNTLAPLPAPQRVLAALFQSVTARTAGFNTIPVARLANETLFLLIVLMFIGASSGSCGGGIKTGTLAALVLWGVSRLRGHRRPSVFGRTISEASMARAVSVTMVSVLVVFTATLILLTTEVGGVSHQATRGRFLDLFFETVSGFGTVGLSMGVTPSLTAAGRLVMTAVMFVGRLGPLIVVLAISRQERARFQYAEESIMIG